MRTEHHPHQAPPERPAAAPPPVTVPVPAGAAPAPAVVARRLAAPGPRGQATARTLHQADLLRAQSTLGNRRVARLLIQRQEPDPAPAGASTAAPGAARDAAPATGLIVEDATDPSPTQLRQSDFLQQLRATVAAAAGPLLAGTPWAADAEPEIARQLAGYAALAPAALERTLRQQLPGGERVQTAAAFFPLAAEQVQAAIRAQLPPAAGGDIQSIVAGAATMASRAVSSATQAVSAAIGVVGGGLAALGRALFKRRPGAAGDDAVPPVLRAELGAGEPLAGAVQRGIGGALGHDFSRVRVHTDGRAAALVSRLGARALAVGEDVAFAEGEYRPGTPIGDALLAHELAHVAQQAGAGVAGAQRSGVGEAETGGLEAEADAAAAGAVVAVHGGEWAAGRLGQPVLPRLKAGLRLQLKLCGSSKTAAASALLESYRKDFPDSAAVIDGSPEALKLIGEAEAAGSKYGGFAEDGPGKSAWPYTTGDSVYIPKAHLGDKITATSDFLFELNNAIRAPEFAKIHAEAAKGTKGTLNAKDYAYKKVEQEVEGMLRLGEIWFEMKKQAKGGAWDTHDGEFYLAEYQAFQAKTKTKDDIIKDVLSRVYAEGAHAGKTVEAYYMEQYQQVSGGK